MTGTWRLGAYLATQGVVAAGSFPLPDPAGAVIRLTVAVVGVGILVAAVLVRRPERRAGWWLIALSGCLTYATGLAIVARYGPGNGQYLAGMPKLVLVVAALLSLAVGLAVLGWRSQGGRWDTLDTAITAAGAFLLAWVFFIEPNLARSASNFTTVAAVAVPACAILVFAMAAKLAFSGALSTWSGRMLLLATAAGLCTAGLVVGPIGAPTVPIGVQQAGAPGPTLAAIVVPPICGILIQLILVTRLALMAQVACARRCTRRADAGQSPTSGWTAAASASATPLPADRTCISP